MQTSSLMMDDLVCGLTLALQWRAAAAAVAPDAAACGGRVGGGGAGGDAAQASNWSSSQLPALPARVDRCAELAIGACLTMPLPVHPCLCCLPACLPAARVLILAASISMARRRCTTPWRCRQAGLRPASVDSLPGSSPGQPAAACCCRCWSPVPSGWMYLTCCCNVRCAALRRMMSWQSCC